MAQRHQKQKSGPETVPDPLFHLSQAFQSHQPIPDYMDRSDFLNTYRSYYHPISSAKGKSLAEEALAQRDRRGFRTLYPSGSIRVVDFASGTGGFAEGILLGLARLLPHFSREVFLFDRSIPALALASEAVRKVLPDKTPIHSLVARLPGRISLPDSIDWLLQANVLAENMEKSEQMISLLEEAFLRLNDGGIMILAEPADRLSSRNLLRVRDVLLDRLKDLRILAPCPNLRNAGCPALANEKDWCHEDRPFSFSPEIQSMAASVGHIKDALKMSYLIGVRSRDLPPPQKQTEQSTLRLVSELRHERGLGWGIFCDGKDRQKIRLLTRHRNSRNQSFFSLERGEEILQPAASGTIVRSGFLDLLPDTPIERYGNPD